MLQLERGAPAGDMAGIGAVIHNFSFVSHLGIFFKKVLNQMG
jgi:hypothetical protein